MIAWKRYSVTIKASILKVDRKIGEGDAEAVDRRRDGSRGELGCLSILSINGIMSIDEYISVLTTSW